MEREFSTNYADMSIDGGIAHLIYKPLDLLDIDVAKHMVKDRIEFKDGTSYPTLFDIRNVKSTSKDARDYLANEGNELVVASALLVNSSVTKMIGNFFITVSKPKKPTKIFTDESRAIEWLEFHLVAEVN
ncbi:hypothetical protein [Ekhidna sp.]|uniref:DUF7793 family protein n=1 Tax=Ekhidna sp. TaxID=2608089 RepID=UPI003299D37D